VKETEQEIGAAAQAHQIIRREVAFLERDRLIMDDARKMVELVKSGRLKMKDEG
jgi:histidine ammonia-lyase